MPGAGLDGGGAAGQNHAARRPALTAAAPS
jgi:hypothetical protein